MLGAWDAKPHLRRAAPRRDGCNVGQWLNKAGEASGLRWGDGQRVEQIAAVLPPKVARDLEKVAASTISASET